MKMTFLGVGSAFSKINANSNLLIEHGSIKLLIDFGRLGPLALDRYGLALKDVTHILITHLHADHVGGMEEIAFMTKFVYKCKLRLLTTASLLERLWDASLRGGLEHIELTPGDLNPQTLHNFFAPEPVKAQTWTALDDDAGFRFYLHPTNHVKGMETYGIEIEVNPGGRDKRFLFSGDTKFEYGFIMQGFQSCSLIFHDCQLFDTGENNILGVHASYQQLRQLPAKVRRQIWLYHYGDTPLPDAKKDGFAGFVTEFQSFTF